MKAVAVLSVVAALSACRSAPAPVNAPAAQQEQAPTHFEWPVAEGLDLSQSQRRVAIFTASPKEKTSPAWQTLAERRDEFRCH